jgi:cbb3-type cytochrome oxidase cytochrome c subunit
MKGLLRLFSGLFATFAFSWVGLALIPNFQIGHLDPQTDEEGTDVYPLPQSGMAERGRHIYTANGCFYCHSQQLRADYAASDLDRVRDFNKDTKWGVRRSAPRDYLFDRPVLLGKERTGPDLANMGKSAPAEAESPAPGASPAASPGASPAQPAAAASPASAAPTPQAAASAKLSSPAAAPAGSVAAASAAANAQSPAPAASPVAPNIGVEAKPGEPPPYSAAWHHQHLYSPRSINPDSNMPAFRFLYEKHRISSERSTDALQLTGRDAPPDDWEIIPTYDAKCLVAFLMSCDQSHPLKEVKSAPAASPAAAPSPAAQGAPK